MGFYMHHYPEENGTVRLITDFRELKKKIQRIPWPMTNIHKYLDAIGGFQFATVIDLNMVYYAMILDRDR